jgi:DNA-binding protein H-NS
MKKTYSQIIEQIETLQVEAEKLKQKEVDEVIARIREAVQHYNLTAADLGLAGVRRGAAKKLARKAAPGAPASAKFRDAQGNTWGGRGPRPKWLRAALVEGKKLEDFAV